MMIDANDHDGPTNLILTFQRHCIIHDLKELAAA